MKFMPVVPPSIFPLHIFSACQPKVAESFVSDAPDLGVEIDLPFAAGCGIVEKPQSYSALPMVPPASTVLGSDTN